MRTGLPIPDGLRRLESEPTGRAWLHRLPTAVAELAAAWDLHLGEPYPGCHVSWVAPAEARDGPAVLKVQWPHPECEHEADALRTWAGNGAVQLLHHDPARHALLVERCEPGRELAATGRGRLAVMAALLGRLARPADEPFRSLTEEARGWIDHLDGAWPGHHLADAAVGCLRDAIDHEPATAVLLHQDLHAGNVLAAAREPWLAIDPKPLVGDPAFAPAPVIRSLELGHSRDADLRRWRYLSDALELDPDRVRRWTVGQTVAWGMGSRFESQHLQTAAWLLGARGAGW